MGSGYHAGKLFSNIMLRLKLLSSTAFAATEFLIRSDLVYDHLSANDMVYEILLMTRIIFLIFPANGLKKKNPCCNATSF